MHVRTRTRRAGSRTLGPVCAAVILILSVLACTISSGADRPDSPPPAAPTVPPIPSPAVDTEPDSPPDDSQQQEPAPQQEDPPSASDSSDQSSEPEEPAESGSQPAALPDLPVQSGNMQDTSDIFDEIGWSATGGNDSFRNSCDITFWDDPHTILDQTQVYGAFGELQVMPGSTFSIDPTSITGFSESYEGKIEYLPALCAMDPAILANAYALAPDGGMATVVHLEDIPIFADPSWTEQLGVASGVTIPLLGLTLPGRWQIIAEYNRQTYTLNIDVPSDGPPFAVADGTLYLASRFEPLERIRLFPAGKEFVGHPGEFEVQADANGHVLFSFVSPVGSGSNYTALYIGEFGSRILPTAGFVSSIYATPEEAYQVYYDYAWGD